MDAQQTSQQGWTTQGSDSRPVRSTRTSGQSTLYRPAILRLTARAGTGISSTAFVLITCRALPCKVRAVGLISTVPSGPNLCFRNGLRTELLLSDVVEITMSAARGARHGLGPSASVKAIGILNCTLRDISAVITNIDVVESEREEAA